MGSGLKASCKRGSSLIPGNLSHMPLTSMPNGSHFTATQSSRVSHLTAVDTKVGFGQDTNGQHAAIFTERDGVVVHPSVSVTAHGVASVDSAGEGGGVSHCNPCESGCDLHLGWYCVGKEQNRNSTTVSMTRSSYGSSVQCTQKI